MIKYLIEKEFKQFSRDPFFSRMVIIMPLVLMLVLPWAVDMGTKNVNLVVVDNDHSPLSERLANKAIASEFFNQVGTVFSYSEALQFVERGMADIILEIPRQFAVDIEKGLPVTVQISANSVNGTKGSLGGSYLAQIISSFSEELRIENGYENHLSEITVNSQTRFNPGLDYKRFMIPALMVLVLTIIGGALPSFNIVSEKEKGTIEQINVSPISKFYFIFSKLILYWGLGIIVLSICMLIARVVYGLVPIGSLFPIYVASLLYIFVLSGLGIVVSNNSETIQQAIFMLFFFLLIIILISGLFTPIRSMPQWAQTLTLIDPVRYYIEIIRSIYLKGSGFADLASQYLALTLFAVFSSAWAIMSYKKRG